MTHELEFGDLTILYLFGRKDRRETREALLFAVACAADPDIKAHLVRLKGKLEMMNDSDWRFLFFHVRVYVDKWMKASQELFFTLKEQVFEEGLLAGYDYAVGGDEK